jgi:hypothetical protein
MLREQLIYVPRIIRTINKIPISNPNVVRTYSIAFRIVLFMRKTSKLFPDMGTSPSIIYKKVLPYFLSLNIVEHIAGHEVLLLM